MSRPAPLTVYEFFAGGGMARIGLGDRWRCLFANDFDKVKAAAYRANFPDAAEHLREGDVWDLTAADLPGRADLAWASSPCQDLSLAGGRRGLGRGLDGGRSSAFWGFWRLIMDLERQDRAPRAIVIENVTGLLTSHGGADFAALCGALAEGGYRFGALQIDASLFLPQSRPRLFVLAVREAPPADLVGPSPSFHTAAVRRAHDALPEALKARWLWWRLAEPLRRNTVLADVLEPDAAGWLSPEKTRALLDQMHPLHRARVEAALASGERRVGTVFRRVRVEHGRKVQRAEARFDGLAGCLRTPAGGSSRQFVLILENGEARARLLTGREAARLMGLPEDYRLPASATGALHLAGDGVAAPVVRHLVAGLIEPLLDTDRRIAAA